MKGLGDAIKGAGIGILLILACAALLIWNEYNNVKNIKAVAEAREVFVQIGSEAVNPDNEGMLTAISGQLVVLDETVTDSLFNVSVHTAKLARTAEMYQWEEESSEDSKGNKEYSYRQVWSERLIDSSKFNSSGHENPQTMPIVSDVFLAEEAKLGAFTLSGEQKTMLPLNRTINDFSGSSAAEIGYMASGSYLCNFSETPQIGDIRVSYTCNNSSEISLLARQTGSTFTAYRTKNGVYLNKVVDGLKPGEEIIDIIQAENNLLKWILRGLGVFFMITGFLLIFKPLCIAGAYIPILGSLVNMAAGLIAFVFGLSLSLVIIAVSWIAVRPLLGIGLLAAAVMLFVLLARHKRSVALSA